MKRLQFLLWMRSWTKPYGHRWRSVRRNGRKQAVRCGRCGVKVDERGKVTSPSPLFGCGERDAAVGLKEWLEASMPACTSLESMMREVMES